MGQTAPLPSVPGLSPADIVANGAYVWEYIDAWVGPNVHRLMYAAADAPGMYWQLYYGSADVGYFFRVATNDGNTHVRWVITDTNGGIIESSDIKSCVYSSDYNFYYNGTSSGGANTIVNFGLSPYESNVDARTDLLNYVGGDPIEYRLTNCEAPGAPTRAYQGRVVTVNFEPSENFGFLSAADVYVTNNGVPIESTFSGNTLTFTMPAPA